MTVSRPLHLTLANGKILRDGAIQRGDIHLSGGLVSDQSGRVVDLSGYLVLPGIIDLHGDGFERHVAPRRGALSALAPGLQALDSELAANGITTAVLAQFMSWEGGMRGPDFAERLIDALARTPLGTETRLQIRLERMMASIFPRLRELVGQGVSSYIVLNDHLPHDALAKGKRPPRLSGQAAKAGRSPDDHHALMQDLHDGRDAAEVELTSLCQDLIAMGARLGSHDDASAEDWAQNRALGCTIAEFPETLTAAEAARADGAAIIMGAPNIVRGGSHAGKISAEDLVSRGVVDALVSDYHYPAPHRAALHLWRMGMAPDAAWGLVSAGPARVMGWADRGHIREGLRADLVIMHETDRRIEGTLCGGRVTYLSGALATRFMG